MSYKLTIVFALCLAFGVAFSSADDCVACDSVRDPNCATDPGKLVAQKCNIASGSGKVVCYARVVNGITYRGCYSELDQGIQSSCLNDSRGESCAICENVDANKGCNNMVFPLNRLRCHSCSESGTITGCFTGFEANATPCKSYNPDDKCYIRKTDKSIERGCLSDTSKCLNPSHCFVCEGDGCNNLSGNSNSVPTAPSSAVAWTSTMFTVLAMAFVSLKLVA